MLVEYSPILAGNRDVTCSSEYSWRKNAPSHLLIDEATENLGRELSNDPADQLYKKVKENLFFLLDSHELSLCPSTQLHNNTEVVRICQSRFCFPPRYSATF